MKDEIELLKSTSGRQMKRTLSVFHIFSSNQFQKSVVESHLDETGCYLHKSAETRDVISELQQDRNSCMYLQHGI